MDISIVRKTAQDAVNYIDNLQYFYPMCMRNWEESEWVLDNKVPGFNWDVEGPDDFIDEPPVVKLMADPVTGRLPTTGAAQHLFNALTHLEYVRIVLEEEGSEASAEISGIVKSIQTAIDLVWPVGGTQEE